jgi:hypothetical protein
MTVSHYCILAWCDAAIIVRPTRVTLGAPREWRMSDRLISSKCPHFNECLFVMWCPCLAVFLIPTRCSSSVPASIRKKGEGQVRRGALHRRVAVFRPFPLWARSMLIKRTRLHSHEWRRLGGARRTPSTFTAFPEGCDGRRHRACCRV